jgi:hypothetical protein
MFHGSTVSVEDPESSETLEAFQEGKLFGSQQGRSDSLLQFQQPPIIDPPEEREKVTPEEPLFFKGKTAVEIDEERFPFFRDQNVPLMP